jgi:methionyl-tRNA formyltransferase
MTATAVVFGYGDVGDRCLRVLLSAGLKVALVVTHEDDPNEARWYASVAATAAECGLPCVAPASPGEAGLVDRVAAIAPDFIFSFYYRALLGPRLLGAARRGAFNMHGSLLPRFRGRAPVNWAILRGATETGATLHRMVERADAGDIIDQMAVPILEDDDALAVFRKVADAAVIVLARSLPGLLDGSARGRPQPVLEGEYYGRRRPEDGRIDWTRPAKEIHDLVRAVAPPFPGAFTTVLGERWTIERTRLLPRSEELAPARPRLTGSGGRCIAECADGGRLGLVAARTAQGPVDLEAMAARLAAAPVELAA